MKKNLFRALLCIGLIGFAACGTKPGPEDDGNITSLEVRPNSLVMNVGQEQRFTAITTPANASEKVKLVWESSDTEVVLVNEVGVAIAVGYGDAVVTVKTEDGKFSASANISVVSFAQSLKFTGAFMADQDTTAYGDELGEVTAGDGTVYMAKIIEVEFWFMSDGFYLTDDYYYAGPEEVAYITAKAPVYWAPGWANNTEKNTIFCLGEYEVAPADGRYMMQALPGSYDAASYGANMEEFVKRWNANDLETAIKYLQAAGESFTGATITYMSYSCDETDPTQCGYSYSYVPDALVNAGRISVNANGVSTAMLGVDYSTFTLQELGGYWGANIEETEEGLVLVDKNLVLYDPITVTYGELPAATVSMQPIHMPVMSEVAPELMQQLRAKAVNVGTLQLRKK